MISPVVSKFPSFYSDQKYLIPLLMCLFCHLPNNLPLWTCLRTLFQNLSPHFITFLSLTFHIHSSQLKPLLFYKILSSFVEFLYLKFFYGTTWKNYISTTFPYRICGNNICLSIHPSITDWLTDWLTPCSRVFVEKLIVTQPVKKFPTFYGTWRFIAEFTRVHH
jgi:hypothetical protein